MGCPWDGQIRLHDALDVLRSLVGRTSVHRSRPHHFVVPEDETKTEEVIKMSHNLYAELADEEENAYYNDTLGKRLDPTEGDYPYEQPPSIGVKVIRDSDWLEPHLVDAVWDEFTPNQSKMYAESLHRACCSHIAESDEETEQIPQIMDIVNWLRYWSDQRIHVHGSP